MLARLMQNIGVELMKKIYEKRRVVKLENEDRVMFLFFLERW